MTLNSDYDNIEQNTIICDTLKCINKGLMMTL